MRFAITTLLLALAAAPAFAQQVSPMTGTTTGVPTVAPTTPSAPASTPTTARRPRHTMEQRFTEANTTHDGKLTLEQAKAGKLTRVVQHFDAMDTGKKGYVTMDDIRAYGRAQRAAAKAAKQ